MNPLARFSNVLNSSTILNSANSRSLRDWADTVFIIRYREDIGILRDSLEANDFKVVVQEGPYTLEQLSFSPSIQCLVNHASAWAAVVESGKASIIVEPDFVPVRGFRDAQCPMPFALDDPGVGFAWLYACGPILYGFDRHGYPHGHAASVAAYILTPRVATLLIGFFEREMSLESAGAYRPWDSYLGVFLRREHGVLNYIPKLQLGEHGSDSRVEHKQYGARKNWHQADVLAGSLAFLPIYAHGSAFRLWRYRIRAYTWGWLRLVSGRFYDPRYINSDTARGRSSMAAFAVMRLLRLV